jgi:ferredoxin
MAIQEEIYHKLQKHLDTMPIGFPKAEDGSDIRVLQAFFTPEEANMVLFINFKPSTLKQVCDRANKEGISRDKAELILNSLAKKRLVVSWIDKKTNERKFQTEPFALGFFETHLNRLTKKMAKTSGEYFQTFIRELLGEKTGLSQMRTIPLEVSISHENNVLTYDNIRTMIDTTKGKFIVNPCVCTQQKELVESICTHDFLERCISTHPYNVQTGNGREISKEELIDILQTAEEKGLVLQPGNTKNSNFFCICCGCCCEILTSAKKLEKPARLFATNYYSQVDSELCTSCETCADRCPMEAIIVEDYAEVNVDRCIGCGVCVPTCPSDAIQLYNKDNITEPPDDMKQFYSKLIARKYAPQ